MSSNLPPFFTRVDALFRIMRNLTRDLAAHHGLTLTQLIVLGHVYHLGPCPMSELKRELEVTTGAVTGLVDRLERMGMVSRTPSQQDRRVVNVAMTPAGLTVLKSIGETMNRLEASWLAEVPADQRARMIETFDMVLRLGQQVDVPRPVE